MFKALLIPFVPFFLLGFFNDILMIGGQQCVNRGLNCCNFFTFLGATEGKQNLAFHMTRVFSSSVLQLIFQLSILLARTPWQSILITQILSILASLLVIIKVTTELLIFAEEQEADSEKKNFCQGLISIFKFKLNICKRLFFASNYIFSLPFFCNFVKIRIGI